MTRRVVEAACFVQAWGGRRQHERVLREECHQAVDADSPGHRQPAHHGEGDAAHSELLARRTSSSTASSIRPASRSLPSPPRRRALCTGAGGPSTSSTPPRSAGLALGPDHIRITAGRLAAADDDLDRSPAVRDFGTSRALDNGACPGRLTTCLRPCGSDRSWSTQRHSWWWPSGPKAAARRSGPVASSTNGMAPTAGAAVVEGEGDVV